MADFSPMKGRKSVQIPLHHVADILHDIRDQGHAAAFAQAAKDADASISVSPKTVNFVKRYLADARLSEQSATAAKVVGGCPGSDPYRCPFQDT